MSKQVESKTKKYINKVQKFFRTKKKESFLLSFLALFFILFFSIVYGQRKSGEEHALKSSDSLLSSDSEISSKSNLPRAEWNNRLYTERKKDEFLSPRPNISRYNLVDVNQNPDPLNSVGGEIYKELMAQESADLARIYDSTGDTPEHTAKQLGLKRSAIMGRYNPQAQGQSANQKSSWAIPYFKNIHYRYYNGDGKEIQESSNVKDILAMASVYTYQHNYLDEERFRAIVNELYAKSHSYSLSIGPVYYDNGCIHKDAKEEMLDEEAKNNSKTGEETKRESESIADTTGESKAESKTGSSESSKENKEESGSKKNALESSKAENTTGIKESSRAKNSEENKKDEKNTKDRDKEDGKQAETSVESGEGQIATEENGDDSNLQSPSNIAKESKKEGKKETNTNSIQDKKKLPKNYCPGHVDLTIKITVIGFDDENGLRNISLDSIKDLEEQDSLPGSRWHGWDEYSIAAVNRLREQDWFKEYGLSISTVEKKSPLTEEEISAYMKDLPEDTSEERKALIRFALSSVGKVPYYYGGKAGSKGLENNHFGASLSESDYKGRNRKGLDCSGFVQWAYWSSVDKSLDFASSTQELIGKGQKIKRSELKAGDLIIQPSGDSHVVMFIKWTKEGKMLAVHENGTAGNVSVDEIQANYPYYRSVLP